MATGDLKNNIQKLISNLKSIRYPNEINIDGVTLGDPTVYLPMYHHMLLEYSPRVAELVLQAGVQLTGRNDRRFMEGVYKIMRDLFAYKPPVAIDKFFGTSFVERKVIMCSDMARLVRQKHETSACFRAKKFMPTKYAGVGLRLPSRTYTSLIGVASKTYHNSPELDSIIEFQYDADAAAAEQPDGDTCSDASALQNGSDYNPYIEQVSVLQQGVEQLQVGVESLRTTLQDQVDQLQYENELLRTDVKSLTALVEKYEHNELSLRSELQSVKEQIVELEKMKSVVPEKENQGKPGGAGLVLALGWNQLFSEMKCDKEIDVPIEVDKEQDRENDLTGAEEFLSRFREPSVRAAANRLFQMIQEHERLVNPNGEDEYPTTG